MSPAVATPPPAASQAPTAATAATASTWPKASPSPDPGEDPIDQPTAPPSLVGLRPTVVDPVLELRVRIWDVTVTRVPTFSVYRDGTVLDWTERGTRITRLTLDAVARLRQVAIDSGLMQASRSIATDPATTYQGGFEMHRIELRSGADVVVVEAPSAFVAADRPAAEAVGSLADRLVDTVTALRADPSAVSVPDLGPYVATSFLLKVVYAPGDWAGDPSRPSPMDLDRVAWPLAGSALTWGTEVVDAEPGDGPTRRCGPVSLDQARLIEAAFEGAWGDERIPAWDHMVAIVRASSDSTVQVSLTSLLPDEPRDCSVDLSFP